jgi:hypothetical protein
MFKLVVVLFIVAVGLKLTLNVVENHIERRDKKVEQNKEEVKQLEETKEVEPIQE